MILKKLIVAGIAVLTLMASSTVALAAAKYSNPAEAVAGLTGRTVESVVEERTDTGKSFGAIAYEAGVLDEFHSQVIEIKKDQLEVLVKKGVLTQLQSDTLLKQFTARQSACVDGNCVGGCGIGTGLGLGGGCGNGGWNGGGCGGGRGNGGGLGGGRGNGGGCWR